MEISKANKELNKAGLQFFYSSFENNFFDSMSNEIVTTYEPRINELKAQIKSDKKALGYMKHMELFMLEEKLLAISKMRIVHAYIHFEIHLKQLIRLCYSEFENINKTPLNRWDLIKAFLKSKDIILQEISNYDQINQLRLLNNVIKHSGDSTHKTITGFSEFKNKKTFTHTDLNQFYTRIEYSGSNFLKSLVNQINRDLFEFDDLKLETISGRLSKRMSNETIDKLIEKLDTKKR